MYYFSLSRLVQPKAGKVAFKAEDLINSEYFLTLLALGGGVFHVNFVCLLITFLVFGRLPPNLVTFPKNYHSRAAWKKI